MATRLGIDVGDLKAQGSYWTAREICQQPDAWIESAVAIDRHRAEIDRWLAPKLRNPRLRIVLAGAGSSAFVGETLAPWLTKQLGRRVDAVGTTDLVGHPSLSLAEDLPTLLVSFARSGNSPESVAGIEIANRALSECHHLVVTCNPDGHLARLAADADALCLLMPKQTDDRSFAMTSSYTAMLVSCAAAFAPESVDLSAAVQAARFAITEHVLAARQLADAPFDRYVVLGAGCLRGTAMEASLKCLELTNGRVAVVSDTPLGFRHGPKSVVDETTCVVLLQSSDPYTARYDLDLLRELCRDDHAAKVVVLSPADSSDRDGFEALRQRCANGRAQVVAFDTTAACDDLWMSLPYLVFCQMLAFFKARSFGIGADNPCPTGEVNRVVQGVTIHPYAA